VIPFGGTDSAQGGTMEKAIFDLLFKDYQKPRNNARGGAGNNAK
jgi:hypothetical protein